MKFVPRRYVKIGAAMALLVMLTSCTEALSFGAGMGVGYFASAYFFKKQLDAQKAEQEAAATEEFSDAYDEEFDAGYDDGYGGGYGGYPPQPPMYGAPYGYAPPPPMMGGYGYAPPPPYMPY
jgi:hypothetical protein